MAECSASLKEMEDAKAKLKKYINKRGKYECDSREYRRFDRLIKIVSSLSVVSLSWYLSAFNLFVRVTIDAAGGLLSHFDASAADDLKQQTCTKYAAQVMEKTIISNKIEGDFHDRFPDVNVPCSGSGEPSYSGRESPETSSRERDSTDSGVDQTDDRPSILRHAICMKVPMNDSSGLYLFVKNARVLMLVNYDFADGSRPRDEAMEDFTALRNVLIEDLNYDDFLSEAINYKEQYRLSEQFNNITADHIRLISWTRDQILELVRAMTRTPFDGEALFIFISSHGTTRDGRSVVSDCYGQPVYVDELIQIVHKYSQTPFNFIFIQACRGDKPVPITEIVKSKNEPNIKDTCIPKPSGLFYDSPNYPKKYTRITGVRSETELGATSMATNTSVGYPRVDCPENFLVAYSTRKHHLSGSLSKASLQSSTGIEEGSIFIQIFLAHLKQFAKDSSSSSGEGLSLLPLLTGAQKAAAQEYQENAEIEHRLTSLPVLCSNKIAQPNIN